MFVENVKPLMTLLEKVIRIYPLGTTAGFYIMAIYSIYTDIIGETIHKYENVQCPPSSGGKKKC